MLRDLRGPAMKIRSITIENFGVFKRRSFDFELAPLVLVYGANEAGKTTALNGIRQAIAGFRTRSSYISGGTMRAEIAAELRSGERLEISRRKGRTDDLTGVLDGQEVDSQQIQALLSRVDIDAYEQLFGFSLDELREGQSALKNVRLSDALAGGSMGGIRAFEKLRRELDSSLTELYKSRGSTPLINVKLAELKGQQETLRSEEILPQEVESLRSSIKDASKQSEAFRAETEQLRKQVAQLNRVQRALPHFETWRAIQSQLKGIDLPEELDASFVTKWADFAEERKNLAAKVEAEKERLAKGEASLKGLSADGKLLNFEKEVERLGHRAEEIANGRDKSIELKQQIVESERRLSELLEQLNQNAVTLELKEFSISLPEKSKLKDWSQIWKSTREQRLSTLAKLEANRENLSAQVGDEDFEFEIATTELADLLTRWEQAENIVEKNAGLVESLRANADYQRLTKEVSAVVRAGFTAQPEWQTPDKKRVQAICQDFNEAKQLKLEVLRTKERQTKELEKLLSEKSENDSSMADVVLAKLSKNSQQRDALLGHWLDELSQPLIAASISVEQQQERLAELKRIGESADQAHEELFSLADELAVTRQAKLQIESLQEQVAEAESQILSLEGKIKRIEDQWSELWASLPLIDQGFDARTAWLDSFARWASQCSAEQKAMRELHISRRVMRDIQSQALDAWPVHIKEGTPRAVLRQQLVEWSDSQRDKATRERRLGEARKAIGKLESELAGLDSQHDEVERELKGWLDRCPVDCDWPFDQISQLIEFLEGIRREAHDIERYQGALSGIERDIREFEASIAKLATELGVENLDLLSSDLLAKDWLNALHEVRSERSQRVRITSELEFSRSRLEEWSKRLETIDGKLVSLCSTTGLQDVSEVSSLLQRAKLAEELKQRLAETNAALTSIWPGDEAEMQIDSLAQCDATETGFQLQECNERLAKLERLRKEADQQVGSLQQKLEQISGGRAAQQAAQKISLLRGELADLADQWIVEKVGQVLLRKTIESFSKDHEPKLLSLTRNYLSQLTGGRYVDVKHDESAKHSFSVFNAKGEAYEPSQLSTGTREQLYLAIRMAFIIHHCEQNEPLPVLMDDCFVNFDDDRARHAIEAIGEWDNSIQTVILSCHSRTLDIVRESVPDAKIIMLGQESQVVA